MVTVSDEAYERLKELGGFNVRLTASSQWKLKAERDGELIPGAGRVIVIARKPKRNDEGVHIIMVDQGPDVYERYVTWVQGPDGSCVNGHYSTDYERTLADFETRR